MKQIFLSILLLSLPLLTISVQTFLKKTIPHSISTMETRLLVKIYDKRDFTNSPNEFSTRTFIINPVLVYFFEREVIF